MGKYAKRRRASMRQIIEEALAKAERPTLERPDLATHSVVIFAIEHVETFRMWLNSAAQSEDEKLSRDEVKARLDNLHQVIDMAIGSMPIPASLLEATNIRIVPPSPDDGAAGPYL
jgi:hypothetical protein